MQREVIVLGYTRRDGTYVPTHSRPHPTESSTNSSDNSPKSKEYCSGYVRSNGTIVKGYYKSS